MYDETQAPSMNIQKPPPPPQKARESAMVRDIHLRLSSPPAEDKYGDTYAKVKSTRRNEPLTCSNSSVNNKIKPMEKVASSETYLNNTNKSNILSPDLTASI